ncbi:hypothetical protein BDV41DRAFT_536654 [Aspergillus transmontanensis]|uniref:Uncharacterized protein n=1 Tax=Aspergillus transmontanensis TaxID=1034304 RepID=A0A5N6VYX7_9EURO|nr:hypothetical protein BDV41DRAFT_536654 [Aspergillus transmontanensis]
MVYRPSQHQMPPSSTPTPDYSWPTHTKARPYALVNKLITSQGVNMITYCSRREGNHQG